MTYNSIQSEFSPDDYRKERTKHATLPYLLFAIGEGVFGIASKDVVSIESLGKLTPVVEAQPHIRGGAVYDGEFLELVDLRRLFGMESLLEEATRDMEPHRWMNELEQWVAALERSVAENREFPLSDDPYHCAFGRWLKSYQTANNTLNHYLYKIKTPHDETYHTAKQVKRLMRESLWDQAMLVVTQLRETHYDALIKMISQLKDFIATNLREIYIVLSTGNGTAGIIVDSIVGIEDLPDEMPKNAAGSEYVRFVSTRRDSETPIIVLDTAKLAQGKNKPLCHSLGAE